MKIHRIRIKTKYGRGDILRKGSVVNSKGPRPPSLIGRCIFPKLLIDLIQQENGDAPKDLEQSRRTKNDSLLGSYLQLEPSYSGSSGHTETPRTDLSQHDCSDVWIFGNIYELSRYFSAHRKLEKKKEEEADPKAEVNL
ncbi:hypothetical protein K1719_007620 [Acacia pycnantha]|nr:hypothetical protein K1719_007620 [Acacia pycnantha]